MINAMGIPRTTIDLKSYGCWWSHVSTCISLFMRCPECGDVLDLRGYEIKAGAIAPEVLCIECGFFRYVHLQDWL